MAAAGHGAQLLVDVGTGKSLDCDRQAPVAGGSVAAEVMAVLLGFPHSLLRCSVTFLAVWTLHLRMLQQQTAERSGAALSRAY